MKSVLIPFSILVALALFGCKKSEIGSDARLYGVWGDDLSDYYFQRDETYAVIYKLTGSGQDSVKADSVFGIFEVDIKRSNINFNQRGFKLRNDSIFFQGSGVVVWNYTINGNILEYRSNTISGKLEKKASL